MNDLVLDYVTTKFIPRDKGSANEDERNSFKDYLRGEPIDIDDLGDDTETQDTAERLNTEHKDLVDCAFVFLCFPYGNPPKTFGEEQQLFPLCAEDAYQCFTDKWMGLHPDKPIYHEVKECLSLGDAKTALISFFENVGQRAKQVKVVTIGQGGPGGLFRMKNEGQAFPSKKITEMVDKVITTQYPRLVDVVFCQCHASMQLQSADSDRVQVHALAQPQIGSRVKYIGRYRVQYQGGPPVRDEAGNRDFVSGMIPLLREYLLDFEAEETEMQVDTM